MQEDKYDTLGPFYIRIRDSECFDNLSLFVINVPLKHNTLKLIEAKDNELKNWKDSETYKEVD